MEWSVYMIKCSDDSLYTGITNDLDRRFRQHVEKKGAKYFRSRQPIKIVYVESNHSHISAAKREAEIKKMSREQKLMLIQNNNYKVRSTASMNR